MKKRISALSEKIRSRFSGAKFGHGVIVGLCLAVTGSLIAATAMNIQKKNAHVEDAAATRNEYDTVYVIPMEGESTDVSGEDSTTVSAMTEPGPHNPVNVNGSMLVKQKKYDYKGGNVMILDITNMTTKDYTLTINAEYKNGEGKVIKTETRVFEGFPSGYHTYFVFKPNIKFYGFNFQLSGDEYTDTTYASYFKPGETVSCSTHWGHVDERGRYIIPHGEEQVKKFKTEVMIGVSIIDNIVYPCEKTLSVSGDIVLFNKLGELIYIGDARGGFSAAKNENDRHDRYSLSSFPPMTTGIPSGPIAAGNKYYYPLPEEYRDVTGFYAVKEVYPTDEKETAFPRTEVYWRH